MLKLSKSLLISLLVTTTLGSNFYGLINLEASKQKNQNVTKIEKVQSSKETKKISQNENLNTKEIKTKDDYNIDSKKSEKPQNLNMEKDKPSIASKNKAKTTKIKKETNSKTVKNSNSIKQRETKNDADKKIKLKNEEIHKTPEINTTSLSDKEILDRYSNMLNGWYSSFEEVKIKDEISIDGKMHYISDKYKNKEDIVNVLKNYFTEDASRKIANKISTNYNGKFYMGYGQIGDIPNYEYKACEFKATQTGSKITLTITDKRDSKKVMKTKLTLVKENGKWLFENFPFI
ncbi:DL-endopeptidase inhibitor IseA family protein [Hathewaya histolytica]|uniref:DL-endopeptidase inhibitor IseA family protein n=1 Tax=Hathewaya histolytica TaxID=1498 RepID=UPI003B66D72D